jgi:t-SNARE complex subunit (syntaxin)
MLQIKNFHEKYVEKNGNANDFKSEIEKYIDIKNDIKRNLNIINNNIRSLRESNVTEGEEKKAIDDCIEDTEKFLKELNQNLNEIDTFIQTNGINLEEENINGSNIFNNNQEQINIQLNAVQLVNNKEFLQKRENELKHINKLSQNIKEASDFMKINVHEQGKELNIISDNVNEMEKYVDKADEQIKKAKNMDKKTNKKLCCIYIIIVILICTIIALVAIIIAK